MSAPILTCERILFVESVADLPQLHAFAADVGLSASAFRAHHRVPHYFLAGVFWPAKVALHGAKRVGVDVLVALCRKLLEAQVPVVEAAPKLSGWGESSLAPFVAGDEGVEDSASSREVPAEVKDKILAMWNAGKSLNEIRSSVARGYETIDAVLHRAYKSGQVTRRLTRRGGK